MAEFRKPLLQIQLKAPILKPLTDLGLRKPSPIRAECILHLLGGRDGRWAWPRPVKTAKALYRCS